jgi:hypothetical protein
MPQLAMPRREFAKVPVTISSQLTGSTAPAGR